MYSNQTNSVWGIQFTGKYLFVYSELACANIVKWNAFKSIFRYQLLLIGVYIQKLSLKIIMVLIGLNVAK